MEGRADRGPVVFGPLAGVPLRVIAAGTPGAKEPGEAEQRTDARGEAGFPLRPGEYWVYVPFGRGLPGRPGATVVGGNLLDGQPAMAWSPVAVGEQETVEVTLTVVVALP